MAIVAGAILNLEVFAPAAAQTAAGCEAGAYGLSTSLDDNTAALTRALQACRGRVLHVRAGTYRFLPGQFVRGIFMPDATSLVGDGPAVTVLQIAGPGNYDSFLWIRDISNVSIRGLTLQGNGVPYQAGSCTYDYGRAISILSETARGSPVTNINIASNVFRNFVGSGWISMYAAADSPGIGTVPAGANISVEGNFFQSAPGNSVAPNSPTCNSSAVQIFGGDTVPNIVNVSVTANGFDTSYLKQGIIVYGSAAQITIAANSISGTGQKLPMPKDSSLYGILIYQKELRPDTINIVGNQILNPFSCGVYAVAARNITINGNAISGQVDTGDGIEPKAAICLSHIDNGRATVLGNTISQSHMGLAIAESSVPNVRQNSISQIPADGVGIKISADGEATVGLFDNSVSAHGTNVSGLVGYGEPRSLVIIDLYETGAAYPIRWYRDPNGMQPFCNFSEVGTIRNVLERSTAWASFAPDLRFSVGCR